MGLAVDQESRLAVVGSCGRIIAQSGRLVSIHTRWLPYWGNQLQVLWDQYFPSTAPDRCEIFYNRSMTSPDYLTLSYLRSSRTARCNTIFIGLLALDEIARQMDVKAIVCHVTNRRISDRLMARLGWDRHCPHWRGRHFIKRFYGNYPSIDPHWRKRLDNENESSDNKLETITAGS